MACARFERRGGECSRRAAVKACERERGRKRDLHSFCGVHCHRTGAEDELSYFISDLGLAGGDINNSTHYLNV